MNVLIGIDYYFSFITGKVLRGKEGHAALDSKLGWILCGGQRSVVDTYHCYEVPTLRSTVNSKVECDVEGNDYLRKDLNRFSEVESLSGNEEECVGYKFEKEIYHNGIRYVTKLPFRPDHDPLPDNYSTSEKRLISLKID